MRLLENPAFPQNRVTGWPDKAELPAPMSVNRDKTLLQKPPGRDSVYFGNGVSVPYQQRGPAWVTLDNPASGSNCQICSVKNMLHYYGLQPDTIERMMETGLKPYLLEEVDEPNNPGVKSRRGLFEGERAGQYDIKPEVLRDFLTERLGMRFGVVSLGQHNNQEKMDVEATHRFLAQCAAIRDNHQPVLMGLDHGAPGFFGGRMLGHAIFAYPGKGTDVWHIVDSEERQIRTLSGDDFDKHIFKNAYEHQVQIFPVLKGPDREKVARFRSDMPPRSNSGTPSSSTHTTSPETEVPIKPAKPHKPLQQTSTNHRAEVPAPPAETVQPAGEESKPSIQKSETKPAEQTKPSWYRRLGQWFKAKWSSLTQSLKRFGNWIKGWFSFKKAD